MSSTATRPKALYAMDSLKRAMRWDEEKYGREYDLDIFMIVAVSRVQFRRDGEQGPQHLQRQAVAAEPETATDDDYARIESVVAHEYFHNWTGDRITCRDWFQLSLKEGLTVFRDQKFSADMRSPAVKRIEDVKMLRMRQFLEDAGPLAHPVQPQSYIAIDNFYTATVYEKGSEVIGMLKTLVGRRRLSQGDRSLFRAPRWSGRDGRGLGEVLRGCGGRDLASSACGIASPERRASKPRANTTRRRKPTR